MGRRAVLTKRLIACFDVVDGGVPFLGICIGLQVLFEHSEEGPADCLGWIPGRVRRFPDTDRVPQIGWNEVQVARAHPLVAGWPEHPYCYFVNSFHARVFGYIVFLTDDYPPIGLEKAQNGGGAVVQAPAPPPAPQAA